MAKRGNRVKEAVLQLLQDEGPLHVYAIYRRIKDSGLKVSYGTVRWQVLFLTREGLIRPLPPGEAESLGLKMEPDRSGRSWSRPWIPRRYYEVA